MRVRSARVCLAAVVLLVGCSGSSSDDTKAAPAASSADSAIGPEAPATSSAAAGDIEGVVAFDVGTVVHTEDPVVYAETPPMGGDHFPGWLNCGSYDTPQPNEQAVHSMEHGAVWIAYDPTLGEADVTALRAFTTNQTHVLVTPFDGLTSKVVASAWGFQLKLDDVADPRLKQFIETYQNGPQTPEPGAPCSGALGKPL
jgi:Protein of unknown function (DUF3105)